MATANSKLKIDFGFDSFASSNVNGDMRVSGNLVVNGTLSYTGTSTSDWIPASDQLNLGNTTNRWSLVGYAANLASTLTVNGSSSLDSLTVTKTIGGGNSTITGFVNATSSINAASLTVGTSFIANSTGTYSGLINASSITLGNSTVGFTANSIGIFARANDTIYIGSAPDPAPATRLYSISTLTLSVGDGLTGIGGISGSGSHQLNGNTILGSGSPGELQRIYGNVNFDTGTLFVDSVNNRIGINNTAPGVAFVVTGAANISTSVNSALLTVGASFIANTTGAYHTGTINALSITIGTSAFVNATHITSGGSANLTALDSTIRVGNSTVNAFVNSTLVAIGTGNFSVGANVGANVNISNSSIVVGNSTYFASVSNALLRVSNATSTANLSPLDLTLGQTVVNSTAVYVSTGTFTTSANVGANVFANTSTLVIGNSTVNSSLTSSLFRVVNATSSANLSAGDLTIGTTVVNSSVVILGSTFIANSTGAYHTGIVNAASYNIGTGFVANTVGIISNNFISNTSVVAVAPVLAIRGGSAVGEGGQIVLGYGNNLASSITGQANNTFNLDIFGGNTGSTPIFRALFINNDGSTTAAFNIANTGRMHVGSIAEQTDSTFKVNGTANVTTSVNSALLTVGTSFIANSTAIVGTGFANVTTSVNSALLTVGTNFIANTTGAYHTGIVNAASYTTTGFVANTTAIAPTSNSVLLGNSTGRFVLSANSGNFSGTVTVSSDNTTGGGIILSDDGDIVDLNDAYCSMRFNAGVRIYSANKSGTPVITLASGGTVNAASFTVGTNFIANTTALVITTPLTANGSTGTLAQVLSSNGTSGSPYWATPAAVVVAVTDDTTTAATYYPTFVTATSGTTGTFNVSSSKMTFNPSTGTLTSTIVTASSDEKLKTNIKTIESPVEVLSKLRGVSFDRIDSGISDYGVIAQEIEQVLPDIVHTSDEGYKSVSYNSIIGFLIEAVKRQQDQIDTLMQDKYPK